MRTIVLESNGARAVIELFDIDHLFKYPRELRRIADEIDRFKKYFWADENEDWKGVNQDYFEFFDPDGLLKPIDNTDIIYDFDDTILFDWVPRK